MDNAQDNSVVLLEDVVKHLHGVHGTLQMELHSTHRLDILVQTVQQGQVDDISLQVLYNGQLQLLHLGKGNDFGYVEIFLFEFHFKERPGGVFSNLSCKMDAIKNKNHQPQDAPPAPRKAMLRPKKQTVVKRPAKPKRSSKKK